MKFFENLFSECLKNVFLMTSFYGIYPFLVRGRFPEAKYVLRPYVMWLCFAIANILYYTTIIYIYKSISASHHHSFITTSFHIKFPHQFSTPILHTKSLHKISTPMYLGQIQLLTSLHARVEELEVKNRTLEEQILQLLDSLDSIARKLAEYVEMMYSQARERAPTIETSYRF